MDAGFSIGRYTDRKRSVWLELLKMELATQEQLRKLDFENNPVPPDYKPVHKK
jgi:hypothetical protein